MATYTPGQGNPGPIEWAEGVDAALPDASRLTTGTVDDARLPVSAQAATLARVSAASGIRLAVADVSSMSVAGTPTATTWITPDGSGVVVHPSVRFIPGGLGGYQWWAVMTPYTGTNNQVENPCLMVSTNGTAWVPAPGVTNPLVPVPASGYNSDPNLVVGPDGTLLLFYREYVAPAERVRLLTSADGRTWTAPVTVLENVQNERRLVSPSVRWDGASWVMLGVNIATAPYIVERWTAPAPAGPWTIGAAVTFPVLDSDPWHFDAVAVGAQVVGLMNTTGGLVWLVASDDGGQTWTAAPSPLVASIGYKGCLVPTVTEAGLAFEAWLGVNGPTWGINRALVRAPASAPVPSVPLAHSANTSLAAQGLWPFLVGDTFNRADSATGLGVSTSGATWTNATGVIGILAGQAYAPAAANSRAITTLSAADHITAVRIVSTGQAWLVDRYVDGNNFIRFGKASGLTIQLERITAGSVTQLGSAITVAAGEVILSMKCAGSLITCYLNGAQVYQVTETQGQTAAVVGFQTENTAARFDDYYASALT